MDLVAYGKRIGVPNLRDKNNYLPDYDITNTDGTQSSFGFDAMVNDICCHPSCHKAIMIYYANPVDVRARTLAVVDEELLDRYFLHESMDYLTDAVYQSLTIKRPAQEVNDYTVRDI